MGWVLAADRLLPDTCVETLLPWGSAAALLGVVTCVFATLSFADLALFFRILSVNLDIRTA
jgi:hypothetical protein